MTHQHGTFILLQEGKAVCYASDFNTIRIRLTDLFAKNATADYAIAQVVGTVDKPTIPVIHSVYG